MIAECERFWFMYQYLSTGQRKPHKRHQSYTLVVFFYSFFWFLLLLFVIKVAPCLDSNLAYFYHIHMTICIYLLYSVYGLNCLNPPKCYRKAKNRQSDVLSIIVIHHFVPGLQRLIACDMRLGTHVFVGHYRIESMWMVELPGFIWKLIGTFLLNPEVIKKAVLSLGHLFKWNQMALIAAPASIDSTIFEAVIFAGNSPLRSRIIFRDICIQNSGYFFRIF